MHDCCIMVKTTREVGTLYKIGIVELGIQEQNSLEYFITIQNVRWQRSTLGAWQASP